MKAIFAILLCLPMLSLAQQVNGPRPKLPGESGAWLRSKMQDAVPDFARTLELKAKLQMKLKEEKALEARSQEQHPELQRMELAIKTQVRKGTEQIMAAVEEQRAMHGTGQAVHTQLQTAAKTAAAERQQCVLSLIEAFKVLHVQETMFAWQGTRADIWRVEELAHRGSAEFWLKKSALTGKDNSTLTVNERRIADGCALQEAWLRQDIAQRALTAVMTANKALAAWVHSPNREDAAFLALAQSMYRVKGRFAKGVAMNLCVSARWVELKSMTPEQLAAAKREAGGQVAAIAAVRALLSNLRPQDEAGVLLKHGIRALADWHLDDALETALFEAAEGETAAARAFITAITEGRITKAEVAALVAKEQVLERLSREQPGLATAGVVAERLFDILQEARRIK